MSCSVDGSKSKSFGCLPLQCSVVVVALATAGCACYTMYEIVTHSDAAVEYLVLKSVSTLFLILSITLSLLVIIFLVPFFQMLLVYEFSCTLISQIVELMLLWVVYAFQRARPEKYQTEIDRVWPTSSWPMLVIRTVVLMCVLIIYKLCLLNYLSSLYNVLQAGATGWEGIGHADVKRLIRHNAPPSRPAYAERFNKCVAACLGERLNRAHAGFLIPFSSASHTSENDEKNKYVDVAELREKYCRKADNSYVVPATSNPESPQPRPLKIGPPKQIVPRMSMPPNTSSLAATRSNVLGPAPVPPPTCVAVSSLPATPPFPAETTSSATTSFSFSGKTSSAPIPSSAVGATVPDASSSFAATPNACVVPPSV